MKIFSFFLSIFFLAAAIVTKSQISSFNFDDDQHVYWFYIKAEIKNDKELKKPVYIIRRFGKDVKSGTFKKYKEEVWRYIKAGNQLTIGPFIELIDAKRANETYNLARKTNEEMEKDIENTIDTTNNTYYWYALQFSKSDRTDRFIPKRQPARVTEGSLKDFKYFLWSSLVFEQLAIGPFTNQIEAEESKRIYRLEDYKFHKQYKRIFNQ
ncbi:MAG: hypothetical protein ABFS35_08555 [Bacteroidota bacterium]